MKDPQESYVRSLVTRDVKYKKVIPLGEDEALCDANFLDLGLFFCQMLLKK
jgi:hypothetical protein